jgi:hypothetical protein
MRLRFDVCVYGYVIMPEHVHLRLSEPADFARDCSSQVSAQKTGANLGHLRGIDLFDPTLAQRTRKDGAPAMPRLAVTQVSAQKTGANLGHLAEG